MISFAILNCIKLGIFEEELEPIGPTGQVKLLDITGKCTLCVDCRCYVTSEKHLSRKSVRDILHKLKSNSWQCQYFLLFVPPS